MTTPPQAPLEPSPTPQRIKTPGWLDLRLVAGVLLILVAVVGGAAVVSSADHRQARWAVTRDLAAGTVLSAGDVQAVRVQLGAADSQYLSVRDAVVGRAVAQPLTAGMLLSKAALSTPQAGVTVTIPLRPDNGPKIAKGDRITVWLSTKSCQGQVLVSGVPVQGVSQSGDASFGSDGGSVLVVNLPEADAKRVVSALDLDGAVIRAGLLSDGQNADTTASDLSACAAASSSGAR